MRLDVWLRPTFLLSSRACRSLSLSKRRVGLWPTILLALLLVALPLGASAQTEAPDDPNLEQRVEEDEATGDSLAEVQAGHVDLGPRVVDDEWVFMARDDTATPPVWRYPKDFVLRVNDAALMTVPDDPQFEFLGIGADEQVHVIPQTEVPGTVWLGWNTQDPTVVPLLEQGAEFVLHDFQGPGEMHLFLSTGFDDPISLWNSTTLAEDGEQAFWVEGNTHVHANWIFTEPGVYLVTAEFRAARSENPEHSATGMVMLAVGDSKTTQETLDAYAAAESQGAEASPDVSTSSTPGDRSTPGGGSTPDGGSTPGADPTLEDPDAEPDDANTAMWLGIGAGAAIVVVGLIAWLLVRRSSALRASVEAEDAGSDR